jgi:hypothetical protein
MERGLIAGLIGFAIGFGVERLITGMSKDIARYEKMRTMSGEAPLIKELFSSAVGFVGDMTMRTGAPDLVAGLTNDLVRYANMRSM